jgi:hypothetical protein
LTWRCSYESALKPVEAAPDICNNGPYRIIRGSLAAYTTHEAGHAVAAVVLGKPIEKIEVELRFERGPAGLTDAYPSGVCVLASARKEAGVAIEPLPLPLLETRATYCWRRFVGGALFQLAGPAAELKHLAEDGLSRCSVGGHDLTSVDRRVRFAWLLTHRDGAALARLAWKSACALMDDASAWKAVRAVEAELFSGLLAQEPMDPRPGDRVEFVMPGERAEELIAGAGIAPPNIIDVHRCGPECVRPSRKTSRRWERYLAEWAKEEPKNAA